MTYNRILFKYCCNFSIIVLCDCLKFLVVALNSTSQWWMRWKIQMFSKTTQKPDLALGREVSRLRKLDHSEISLTDHLIQ